MIIGIIGKAGSGKDTIADLLVRDHGFVKIALADPMKRFLRDIFAFTDEQLWGPSSARNAPDDRFLISEGYAEAVRKHEDAAVCASQEGRLDDAAVHHDHAASYKKSAYLSPRHALQQLGTEWGRRCYQDVWVEYALRVAAAVCDQRADPDHVVGYSALEGLCWGLAANGWQIPRGVVISDVRFPNEVRALRAKGGRLWKTTHGSGLAGAAGDHESESYIDTLEADGVIPDSPLEALPMIVTTLLNFNEKAIR